MLLIDIFAAAPCTSNTSVAAVVPIPNLPFAEIVAARTVLPATNCKSVDARAYVEFTVAPVKVALGSPFRPKCPKAPPASCCSFNIGLLFSTVLSVSAAITTVQSPFAPPPQEKVALVDVNLKVSLLPHKKLTPLAMSENIPVSVSPSKE